MVQTPAPFVLKDVSLTLKKKGAVTEPIEFRCQLKQAQLTPTPGTGSGATMETFCATYDSSGTSKASWVLDLAGFQAWADVTDFSRISYVDEGEEYEFTLMPIMGVVSDTNPAFAGEVTMVATPAGGTANQYAEFTASLPLKQKADMITAEV